MRALYVMILIGAAGAAYADGTHDMRIPFKNTLNHDVYVTLHNGSDFSCNIVPHKDYTIKPGETQTVKCHGEGRNKCHYRVKRTNSVGSVIESCIEVKKDEEVRCRMSGDAKRCIPWTEPTPQPR